MKRLLVVLISLCLYLPTHAKLIIYCPPPIDLGCNPSFSGIVPKADPDLIDYKTDCHSRVSSTYKDVLRSDGCTKILIRTWTLTDGCGNRATCDQKISWTEDKSPPILLNCIDDLTLDPEKIPCDPDLDRLIPRPNPDRLKVKDNCSEVKVYHKDDMVTKEGCLVTLTRTYEAVDACGNTATCTRTFKWYETQPLNYPCPADKFLGCNPDLEKELLKLDLNIAAAPSTSCKININVENSTILVFGCQRSLVRTYFISDQCGNEQICFQNISWIEDYEAPVVLFGPENWDLGCTPSHIPPPDPKLFKIEDCSRYTVTHVEDIRSEAACRYQITRIYKITDECDNETAYTHTIQWWVDTEPPSVSCPKTLDLGCNPEQIPAPDPSIVHATDNCEIATIEMIASSIVFDPIACRYTIHRTYEATDHCGNKASCDHIITWKENVQPPDIINCPADSFLGYNIDTLTDIPSGAGQPFLVQAHCSYPTTWSTLGSVVQNGCIQSITRTYYVSDDCDNTSSCDQTYYWIVDSLDTAFTLPQDVTLACYEDVSDYWPVYNAGDTIDSIPCADIYLIYAYPDFDPVLNLTTCTGSMNFHYQIVGPTTNVAYTQHFIWALNLPFGGCSCGPPVIDPIITSNTVGDGVKGERLMLQIFPNPTIDFINVSEQHDSDGNATYMITDLTGRVVTRHRFDRTLGQTKETIDLSDLSPGVYFLSALHAPLIRPMKLIIQ